MEIRSVDHLPEYVLGFPAYVAITVQSPPDTALNYLRLADLVSLRESIGVEIRNERGAEVFRYLPRPIIDPEFGANPHRLAPGEVRRMLTDVSPFFGSRIEAGTYEVRLSFVSPEDRVDAAPTTIRLRNPTRDEEEFRARVASDRSSVPNWATWTIECPRTPIPVEIRQGPLVFSLVLRYLFCSGVSPRNIDPARLDVLTGLYAPERDALKAEIYMLSGDRAAYTKLRTETLQSTPGLEWWFRMIDGGGGFLKNYSVAARR